MLEHRSLVAQTFKSPELYCIDSPVTITNIALLLTSFNHIDHVNRLISRMTQTFYFIVPKMWILFIVPKVWISSYAGTITFPKRVQISIL